MEGMGQRASVKQIIHMSSPSCLRGGDRVTLLSEHPCRQGRHSVSPAMPPQGQPQAIIKETLVQAFFYFNITWCHRRRVCSPKVEIFP